MSDNYKWHPARHLPTPRIPLKVRLDSGEIIDAMRPGYIVKYDLDDLGYRDKEGNRVDPVEWAIA